MRYILVDGRDLTVGDVVEHRNTEGKRCFHHIENISEPLGVNGEYQRWVYVRDEQTGEVLPQVCKHLSISYWKVISGPKVEAARRNSSLVKLSVLGEAHWMGGGR